MYIAFATVEDADEFIGRTVYVEGEKARLIQIKEDDLGTIYFIFEFEDGTIEKLDSLSAYYAVTIDGHSFGVCV